jgi:Mrp family chromosome partitioning ATPase
MQGTEGKSTTVANLALAFALGGRRVVLVDVDLRSPSLHSFFAVHSKRASFGKVDRHRRSENRLGARPIAQLGVRLPS